MIADTYWPLGGPRADGDVVSMPLGFFILGVALLIFAVVTIFLLVHYWPEAKSRSTCVLEALTRRLFEKTDLVFVPDHELPWNEHDVPQVSRSHRHVNGKREDGSEVRYRNG